MRLGFCTLFAWRPHVEHMHYVAQLAREAGHEVRFLACDADLPDCYPREIRRDHSRLVECAKCRAGGLRSYEASGVASIGSLAGRADGAAVDARFRRWAQSSASTLVRAESEDDYAAPGFARIADRLAPGVAAAYRAARRWIERERLDAVFLFNGRMDATRGVLEAAREAGIRPVSLERTWFGDGIQLLPDEHCLGLRAIDRLMAEWRDVPLDGAQARRAAALAASRFLRRNAAEWRAYNVNASERPWPAPQGHRRVLLLPGSRNEVWGFPDIEGTWASRTGAFDLVMERLGLQAQDVVLRCHPNWSERIWGADGRLPERYYTDWAKRRGVHVIASADTTSTLALIRQCEAVVLNGGSAALEAGVLGRQVIALTPSIYQQAGFQSRAYDEADLATLLLDDPADAGAAERERLRRRLTLRFVHAMAHRVAQFVPQVRLVTTTHYRYFDGADPAQLVSLARDGVLRADDDGRASSTEAEDAVLARIEAGDWAALLDAPPRPAGQPKRVQRRFAYRWLDGLRRRLPRGDL